MFNLKNASLPVRKAAAMNGIKSGTFDPGFDATNSPAKVVAKVYNRNNPDGVEILQGECDYAQHMTWAELRDYYLSVYKEQF